MLYYYQRIIPKLCLPSSVPSTLLIKACCQGRPLERDWEDLRYITFAMLYVVCTEYSVLELELFGFASSPSFFCFFPLFFAFH
jgi:hypothetical protein